jgi:hypothetical protein
MYIKPIFKRDAATQEQYIYYRLCESFRQNGMVRQRMVLGLGRLEELPTLDQKAAFLKRLNQLIDNENDTLFKPSTEDIVEQTARKYLEIIKQKNKLDI